MNRLSTRTRIVIVTAISVLFYFFTTGINFSLLVGINWELNFDPLRHILLGLIIYIGTYWALYFKIKKERFLTVLLFPSLAVMAGSFFSELLIVYVFPAGVGAITLRFFSALVVAFFTYISILTVNIMNAHYLTNIPLGQAAKAAYFVLSLLTMFIIYFILLSNDIEAFYKSVAVFLLSSLIVYMCLWSIEYNQQERNVVSFAIGLLITLAEMVLLVWPISSLYSALILNLIFYFTLNMAMEMREKLSKWIWIEYAVLYSFILTVLLVLGEWGINGSIF